MSCSALSRAAGLPLPGTASRADRWIVLEHRAPWGRDAVEDSGLPTRLVEALQAFDGRVLLVRRPGRPQGPPVAFLARTTEEGGELGTIPLDQVEDALDDPDAAGNPVAGQLVLVCTHGRRDVCCATRGVATYNALRRHVPKELLWRSSHQGGHRFAANVLVLPHGIQLGRVETAEAREVAAALEVGRIPLAFYRGRSLHAEEVQAADAAVRLALGADLLTDVRLVSHDGSRVLLDTPQGVHEVVVTEREGPQLPASCGKEPEPTRILDASVRGPLEAA